MQKKEITQKKAKRKEETVEDIYGVHFKYQDLFSRLLKVQKQRRHSEVKSPIMRLPSFDTIKLKRNNSTRSKNTTSLAKRCDSSMRLKTIKKERSTSGKKVIAGHPQTDRKVDIFKSFSPIQKTKKNPNQPKSVKKKSEKKIPGQLRSAKKQVLKPRNA